jgi:hypothetical protein
MPETVQPTPAASLQPPARKPRRSGATAARKPADRPAKSRDDFDRLARRLEADWQMALRKHEAAVHRQFHDLRAALHGRKATALDRKALAALRGTLEPKLKPAKGRAKDLRRVETALDAALARIP